MIKTSQQLIKNDLIFFTNINKAIVNIVEKNILIESINNCKFTKDFSKLCIILSNNGKLKIVDEIYANNDLQELEVALFYFEDEKLYYIAKNKSVYDFLDKIKRKEYLTNAALDMLNMFQKDLLKGDLKTNITLYARTLIPKGISTRNQQIYKFFYKNRNPYIEKHIVVVRKMLANKIKFTKENLKNNSLSLRDSRLPQYRDEKNKLNQWVLNFEELYDNELKDYSDEDIKKYCIEVLEFYNNKDKLDELPKPHINLMS